MKKCRWCQQWRPANTFAPRKRASQNGQLSSLCSVACQEANLQSARKTNRNPQGKAAKARYYNSAQGQANVLHSRNVKMQRYHSEIDRATATKLRVYACSLATGKQGTSPTFEHATGWTSAEFVAHINAEQQQAPNSAGLLNAPWGVEAGNKSIEHKIPCWCYDHGNPVDVRRCWDAANVTVKLFTYNQQKQGTLDLNVAATVPTAIHPVSWTQLPTEAEARDMRNQYA